MSKNPSYATEDCRPEMDVPSANLGHQVIKAQVDNFPRCFDLLSGPAAYYLKWGLPLHRAAMEDDWKTAEAILQQQPNLATALIDIYGTNVLHVAAGANSSAYFIKQLVVNYMTPDDLALQTTMGSTALMYIAQSGENVEAAKSMIEKNPSLPLIRDFTKDIPLGRAANMGRRKMARYLLSVTDLHQLTPADRYRLLMQAVFTDLYDIALEVVNQFPEVALHREDYGIYALQALAKKQLKSHSTPRWSWTKWIRGRYETRQDENMEDKAVELVDKLWENVLCHGTEEQKAQFCGTILDAAVAGNVEFVAKTIRTYPCSIWRENANDRHMFSLAVLNRQVEVFNLIHEIRGWNTLRLAQVDNNGNNSLHMAAMLPPAESLSDVTGAALQMQRELLWFKEVENLVTPQAKVRVNSDGYTPQSLFTANHEELRKQGEKWMKTTATSCFVVAALVATVAFTSVLTVPGGDDQNTGLPIFQRDPIFVTFAVTDGLSLISSSIAILMFMGILTSRYGQDDFLRSLPFRLLIGLTALFFSIAFMMVAFASTFFIIFKANLSFVSIPIIVAVLAAIPVAIFAFDQFPLLVDIYRSTYKAKYLFRNNHRIYRAKKSGSPHHFVKGFVLDCFGKND